MNAQRAKPREEILIVDDSPANLRLLSKMLTDHGYAVRAVTTGERALVSAQSDPPDLILLDIRMPGMDGFVVCERLKQEDPIRDVPVIFISALDDLQDKVKAFAVGCVDYITKPFQLEEVLLRVETHLSLRKLQKQLQDANRRFETELSLAGSLQASLFLTELPELAGWQLAAAIHPARETSGDFYDIMTLPDQRYGILIGDVVDKGVSAALYMAMGWTLFHTFAGQCPHQPEAVFDNVNRRIIEDTDATRFMTVFFGVLDPADGRFAYCNAGHPPPILMRPGEKDLERRLTKTGIPLGIETQAAWQQEVVNLAPGEVLVLFTDGILDAQDAEGTFFGLQGLEDVLRHCRLESAEEIKDLVLSRVAGFIGDAGQYDDIALLVVLRCP